MKLIRTLLALPVMEALAPCITLRRQDELDVVVVDNAVGQAVIALQGAHLLCWQPASQQAPVLWLSDATPCKRGVPLRGGVPICWPWFTDLGGQPHHGIARILPWQLAGITSDEHITTLTFTLTDSAQSRALWDHAFHLQLTLSFTPTRCGLMLSMQGDFEATAALHSYFYTRDIQRVAIAGTGGQGVNTINGLTGVFATPYRFDGESGVIFTTPESCSTLDDPSLARRIAINHHNHSDVVVWNPGAVRAAATADIPDEGWREFACVETARIHQPLDCRGPQPVTLGVQFCLPGDSAMPG